MGEKGTCRISLETLRGRSELSTMPLMKERYRGIRSSSNSSLMKTRFTNSLMLRLLAMASCTSTITLDLVLAANRAMGQN